MSASARARPARDRRPDGPTHRRALPDD